MKGINLLFTILFVFVNISLGQISEIKKDLNQLFFEIEDSPSKYEIRKLFHSDENFHDLWKYDYGNYYVIASHFNRNFKMSYIGNSEKRITFYFPNEKNKSDNRKIRLEYSTHEFDLCQKQSKELLNIFDQVSYKKDKRMIKNNNGEQSGEGWHFFSSNESFEDKKPYFKFHYRYFEMNFPAPNKRMETGYILEIFYEEKNLY